MLIIFAIISTVKKHRLLQLMKMNYHLTRASLLIMLALLLGASKAWAQVPTDSIVADFKYFVKSGDGSHANGMSAFNLLTDIKQIQ